MTWPIIVRLNALATMPVNLRMMARKTGATDARQGPLTRTAPRIAFAVTSAPMRDGPLYIVKGSKHCLQDPEGGRS